MGLLTVLVLAFGLSMDAFAVSVANGMALRPAGMRQALTLSGAFGIFQGGMPLIGWAVGAGFCKSIEAFDHWAAFALLAYIGARMIREAFSRKRESAAGRVLRLKTVLVMAVATSVDALAVGVSFAFSGVSSFAGVLFDCLVIAAVTAAVCTAGFFIGRRFSEAVGRRAEAAGGLVLLAIGLKLLLEHLLGGRGPR